MQEKQKMEQILRSCEEAETTITKTYRAYMYVKKLKRTGMYKAKIYSDMLNKLGIRNERKKNWVKVLYNEDRIEYYCFKDDNSSFWTSTWSSDLTLFIDEIKNLGL